MRSSLASFFSYLFMVLAFVCLVSAFSLIVIALRYYGTTISKTEREVAYYMLILFITAVVLGPIFLHISNRLGKLRRGREEI